MAQVMSSNEVSLLQKHALYVLKVFDAFCAKHKLIYTISYGTLLGALRGGLMIPWDDDIDVIMMRSEYERFLVLAKTHLNADVFVQNNVNDPDFIHAFTRLTLEKTLAVQDAWAELDFNKGIFIDVFPLDTIAPQKYQDQHAQKINKYRRMKLAKLKKENETSSGPIRDFIKRMLLKPFSFSYLNHKLSLETQRYNGVEGLDLIASLTEGVISYYYQYQFDVAYLEDLILISFEGNDYPAPKRSHQLLTEFYSNYMEFPPLKIRKPHHGFVELKFRDDIDELIKAL